MTGALLVVATALGGDLDDMVRIDVSDPPPTGTEPILTYEQGPFSAALGGYVRARSDKERGFDVDLLLYTRGEVLPLLGIRYDVELELPGAREAALRVRQASIAMQLASTDALGVVRLGIMPVPFGVDSVRLLPDRPLLFDNPTTAGLSWGSLPGIAYRLDHRQSWMPLMLEVAIGVEQRDGRQRDRLVGTARLEGLLWGQVSGYRSLRLGTTFAIGDGSFKRHRRLQLYLHFRFDRLLIEAEGAVAELSPRGSFEAHAWHGLIAFDLISEFLEVTFAGGDTTGVAVNGGENETFIAAGARMFVLRRRLVVSFQWQGVSPDRNGTFDDGRTFLAFDLRF